MSRPSKAYLLIEERLGEDLAQHVAQMRGAGHSWAEVGFELAQRTNVVVTAESLRIWFAGTPAARKGSNAGAA
ncbi:MAG: hypothetical protein ACRDP1_12255 [Nocardioidaceae bacterium]